MLTTKVGYPDGITAQVYKGGEVVDLPPSLSGAWLEQGLCEQDKMGKGPTETKEDPLKVNRPKRRQPKA